MGDSDTLLNAGIGAVVTIVTSFLPFSPVLGGAVAGYLQGGTRSEGAKVGGISGALSLLPLLFFGFVVVLFLTGAGAGDGGVALAFMLLVVGTLAVAYTIGLGALGGYVGVYVLEETDIGRDAGPRPGDPSGPSRSRDEQWGRDGWDDEPVRRDEPRGRDGDRRGDREAGWNRDDSAVGDEHRRDGEH